jgi:phage repressor protein C with HTH and peptisase S24 domain
MEDAMLTHSDIWQAIDRLAEAHDLSPSGLAKRAGLDPTTFNKSKRSLMDGRLRWPSTESISKILEATGASLEDFVALIERKAPRLKPVPIIGFAQAGSGGFFDDGGVPVGKGWDEVMFPDVQDEHIYALEIAGDSMMPAYRDGDRIIIAPTAPVRRGDRVVVKTREGEIMAKELRRQTAKTVELKSLNVEHPDRVFALQDVVWMARIMWVSQ